MRGNMRDAKGKLVTRKVDVVVEFITTWGDYKRAGIARLAGQDVIVTQYAGGHWSPAGSWEMIEHVRWFEYVTA